jgi:opacity protein-like surface antigen
MVTRSLLFLSLAAITLLGTANAQYSRTENDRWSRIDFSAGGGFSEPLGRAGNNLDRGWNFDVRGGYRPSSHVALDLDFNFNHWNLNGAALARYGEPGGYTNIWSLSFLPVLSGSPHWHVSPYVFAGPGLYYRNLSLTAPGVVNTFYCDPFFGVCYPAAVGVDQVVASATTYKAGFNGGAGLEFPLGSSRLKVFGEARYSRMFTTHGTDLTFVPVTFGLRW